MILKLLPLFCRSTIKGQAFGILTPNLSVADFRELALLYLACWQYAIGFTGSKVRWGSGHL